MSESIHASIIWDLDQNAYAEYLHVIIFMLRDGFPLEVSKIRIMKGVYKRTKWPYPKGFRLLPDLYTYTVLLLK